MIEKNVHPKIIFEQLSADRSSRGIDVIRRYSLQRQSQPTIVSAEKLPDQIHTIKTTYKREERGELRGQLAFRHRGLFRRIDQTGAWNGFNKAGKRGNNTRERV